MARDPRRHRDEPVRITTAASNRAEEISARQRRYVVSMGVRTVCFVAAILVGGGWLRWVLVAAALLLPYVAVVMANASGSRADGFELLDGQYDRPELGAGPGGAEEKRPDDLGQGGRA
jgi:hypothetical protein